MSFFKRDENKTGGFSPIPEGEYDVVFNKAEPDKTKAGEPMIRAELIILPGQEGAKRKIFDYLLFQDNANFKVNQVAKALEITDAESIEDYAQKIYARTIRIKTKNEEYNGNLNAKVAWYKASTAEGGDATLSAAGTPDNPFGSGTAPTGNDDLPF